MKRRILTTALTVVMAVFSGAASGQGFRLSQPDDAGGLFTAMHPDASDNSGIKSSAMGPGLDLFIRYKLSPNFMVSTGTGIYTLMDKSFSWDLFKVTMFPTFETKFYLMPSNNQKVTPMAIAGLQVCGWKTTFKYKDDNGKTKTETSDKTMYDAAFLIGAGLQFAINERTSFIVSGDYRYQFTAEDDENGKKPKYWAFKAGVAFSLNKGRRSYSKEDEIEYPMGEQELATLDDLFKEDTGSRTDKGGDEDALSLLFQPEQDAGSGDTGTGSESMDQDLSSLFGEEESGFEVTPTSAEESATYPDTEIGQLMAKVDRIKSELDQKSQQVDQLQSKVDALGSGTVSGGKPLADDAFKSKYEAARRKFEMKSYGEAVTALDGLAASNPNHMLASNCHYWMGECYNAMGNYRKAIAEFQTVMQYRQSYKFADALIMSGLCYLKIGENTTARSKFQELIDRYPESEYAPKAMRYLGSL